MERNRVGDVERCHVVQWAITNIGTPELRADIEHPHLALQG